MNNGSGLFCTEKQKGQAVFLLETGKELLGIASQKPEQHVVCESFDHKKGKARNQKLTTYKLFSCLEKFYGTKNLAYMEFENSERMRQNVQNTTRHRKTSR